LKKIDTHSHPKISKHFPLNPEAIVRMAAMGKRVGLDGLALTEHFHAAGFWKVYEHLRTSYEHRHGVFWTDRLALVPGAEVNIREGAHVIVLGELGEIERLDRAFPALLSNGYEPTLEEFLDSSEPFALARIGAHMFRPKKELGKFPVRNLKRLDALEVNGKDFGSEVMLLTQARALGLPVVGGSDAHHWLQVGVRHTLMHTDQISADSIVRCVKEGLTGYGVSPYTLIRVRTAKALKRIAKRLPFARAA
jgi:hypothetical protein